MTTETKRLIRVRTEKGAVFKRDGFGKKRQLSDSWRKPRGQHNKQREQRKAKGNLPKPGFGSPVAVRGMHPSGFFEVLVFMEKDLEKLDAKTQAIRISAGVGARKRKALQEKAAASGFKILNAHMIKEPVREEAPAEPEVEAAKDKKEKKAKEARKEAPAKKSTSRAEGTKKKGAEKKKPVKASTSKSKPASKETAKNEEKAAKPKAKEAAKTPAKKSAPLKAEKKPAAAEKKPAAAEEKPKAEKAKAKKKSSSEVKKND